MCVCACVFSHPVVCINVSLCLPPCLCHGHRTTLNVDPCLPSCLRQGVFAVFLLYMIGYQSCELLGILRSLPLPTDADGTASTGSGDPNSGQYDFTKVLLPTGHLSRP